MPRTKRGRKRRGKPFCRGYDPRRHVFSEEECRRGFFSALSRHPHLYEWLILRAKRRRNGQAKDGCAADGGDAAD